MRYMYDAAFSNNMAQAPLQPGDIVCYYTDGLYKWDQAAIDRYAGYTELGISSIGTDTGDILDCEPGNPDAEQSVNWALGRRAAGVDPTIYTAEWAPGYTKQDVLNWFLARGVPPPHIWIAPWPNDQVPAGCVAAQFGYVGPYDISAVVDGWPGGTFEPPAFGGFLMALTDQQQQEMYDKLNQLWANISGDPVGKIGMNAGDGIVALVKRPELTADDIAKALVAQLPPGVSLDANTISAAVVVALRAQLNK